MHCRYKNSNCQYLLDHNRKHEIDSIFSLFFHIEECPLDFTDLILKYFSVLRDLVRSVFYLFRAMELDKSSRGKCLPTPLILYFPTLLLPVTFCHVCKISTTFGYPSTYDSAIKDLIRQGIIFLKYCFLVNDPIPIYPSTSSRNMSLYFIIHWFSCL